MTGTPSTPYTARAAAPETARERDELREVNAELLAACERAMQEYMRRAWTDPANPGGPCADLRDAIEKARGGAR